jgi:hypothetical protein
LWAAPKRGDAHSASVVPGHGPAWPDLTWAYVAHSCVAHCWPTEVVMRGCDAPGF